MLKPLLCLMLLVACAKPKDRDEKIDPTPPVISDYDATINYALADHLQGSWSVVSRTPDGSAERQGEALLYAGVMLYSVPCDRGNGIEQGLIKMILDNDGQLQRVDPLGEYADGRAVTFDGFAWLLAGVAHRVYNCPGASLAWAPAWQMLDGYQHDTNGRLSDGATAKDARIDDEFTYVRDKITAKIALDVTGKTETVNPDRRLTLEKQIGGWALAVQARHVAYKSGAAKSEPACYPVNLALAFLLGVEDTGDKISTNGRNVFCGATSGMDIPTVDHYCGRSNLSDGYLPSYAVDQWEYRHQRCGAWESPDGAGNRSPRVDKILAYAMTYRVN